MRVCIADDHTVVRDGIRWMLTDTPGVEIVGEAGDAHGALKLLRDEAPDVLFLDLRMDGISGFEVLESAGRERLGTRIVVMSMHGEPANVRRAIELGAAGHLLKSSGRQELLRVLESVRSGLRYGQRDLAPVVVDGVHANIAPREREILVLVANGAENKQIARQLGISPDTVKSYLKNLFARWEVSSRAEAVVMGIRLGVID